MNQSLHHTRAAVRSRAIVAAAAAFALAVTAAIIGAPAALAGTRTPGATLVHRYPAVQVAPGPNLGRPLNLADSGRLARAGFGSALVGSAPTGNSPSELAVNPATHTIYVTNGSNLNGPNAVGD